MQMTAIKTKLRLFCRAFTIFSTGHQCFAVGQDDHHYNPRETDHCQILVLF